MSEIKNWTGERLETFVFNDNTIEHLHRYAITFDYVKQQTVLDIASGEGYGSSLLSKYAKNVIGVDIDIETINLAKEKYKSENIEFKIGSANSIPLDNDSVDVVVSFETLEHHDKHRQMMIEIKRVLKNNGVLIISTPNKKTYSENRNYKNPFHSKELYFSEFEDLINSFFTNAKFYEQNQIEGSLILPINEDKNYKCYSGDFSDIRWKNFSPMYMIAIASDADIEYPQLSYFSKEYIYLKNQNERLEKIINDTRKETTKWMKKSFSFRIGNALLTPFQIFKKKK